MALHTARGRWLRSFFARRGQALIELDAQGRSDLALIRQTRELAPLLMPDAAALQILAWGRAAASQGASFAEAGVYMGGSARLLCEVKGSADFHLFDVFETLQAGNAAEPNGTEREIRQHFGGFHATLAGVKGLLRPYTKVHFHPGVFPQSAEAITNERFAFVHLDLDLPGSTLAALEFFYPRLLDGGIIVGDDYNFPPLREAFETFFSRKNDPLTALPWGQVIVVKASTAICA